MAVAQILHLSSVFLIQNMGNFKLILLFIIFITLCVSHSVCLGVRVQLSGASYFS